MGTVIDVGKDFYHRLVNRNHLQGDGQHTAIEFREKYFSDMDEAWWKSGREQITLDFGNVKTLGPSWANEAFAHFTQFAKPKEILARIKLVNISEVKMQIILNELEAGRSTR